MSSLEFETATVQISSSTRTIFYATSEFSSGYFESSDGGIDIDISTYFYYSLAGILLIVALALVCAWIWAIVDIVKRKNDNELKERREQSLLLGENNV